MNFTSQKEKKKPIIYLIGAMVDCTGDEINGWRDAWIDRWGAEFCRNPARREWTTADYREHFKEIVEHDLDDIDQSDVLLVNYLKPSTGTPMEIVYGFFDDKLVVIVTEDRDALSAWHIYHADYIVEDFDSAERIIRREFEHPRIQTVFTERPEFLN